MFSPGAGLRWHTTSTLEMFQRDRETLAATVRDDGFQRALSFDARRELVAHA